MLNRGYLEETVTREGGRDLDVDPVAEVMISGIRAAAAVDAKTLRPAIEELSTGDRSLKVRQAALEALAAMG
jgi:hypothetical protein